MNAKTPVHQDQMAHEPEHVCLQATPILLYPAHHRGHQPGVVVKDDVGLDFAVFVDVGGFGEARTCLCDYLYRIFVFLIIK